MITRAKKVVNTTRKNMLVAAAVALLADKYSKHEKKPCPDCTNHKKDPEYAIYSNGCPVCEKRILEVK